VTHQCVFNHWIRNKKLRPGCSQNGSLALRGGSLPSMGQSQLWSLWTTLLKSTHPTVLGFWDADCTWANQSHLCHWQQHKEFWRRAIYMRVRTWIGIIIINFIIINYNDGCSSNSYQMERKYENKEQMNRLSICSVLWQSRVGADCRASNIDQGLGGVWCYL